LDSLLGPDIQINFIGGLFLKNQGLSPIGSRAASNYYSSLQTVNPRIAIFGHMPPGQLQGTKQRIPRTIERRFQSAEHNARRMTTPTFKFVQIARVYVRVFR
jgi:hypothetical protein